MLAMPRSPPAAGLGSGVEDGSPHKTGLRDLVLIHGHRFFAVFTMRKLSSFFPDLIASRNQSGCRPRPAQVREGRSDCGISAERVLNHFTAPRAIDGLQS
jgi:hypothetical protein